MNNNKPYPQMQQGGQQMYQASDGKWYPVSAMPQGQQYPPPGQGYYGQQQQMRPQQPVIIDQGYGGGYGRTGGGMGGGLLAGLCAGLLCFDLGACLC